MEAYHFVLPVRGRAADTSHDEAVSSHGYMRGALGLGATVKGAVLFDGATIEGNVSLAEAMVSMMSLYQAMVKSDVSLVDAVVDNDVSLDGATVKGRVSLDGATVKGRVSLGGATVRGYVSLGWSTVEGEVLFDKATIKHVVSLDRATVRGEALLGPMSTAILSVAGTEFARLVSLDVTAERVELSRTRFLGGLTARVGEAEVVMERVEMQGPAVLAHATTGSGAPASPPRLLQLAGTDVASLTLAGVNLRACRFLGSINLDKLHIDGSPQLDIRHGWRAHRKVLDEENEWWDKYALSTDFIYNVFLYDALFGNCSLTKEIVSRWSNQAVT